jgi:peptidoglycan/LPS O-acetylase OafA/YrhL
MVNGASPFQISDNVIMLIASIVIAVLYFVAIFMFSNLKRQMKFARAISILQALLLIGELVFIKTSQSAPVELTWGWIPALVSILCAIVAIRLMNRDHALLRSADRLR